MDLTVGWLIELWNFLGLTATATPWKEAHFWIFTCCDGVAISKRTLIQYQLTTYTNTVYHKYTQHNLHRTCILLQDSYTSSYHVVVKNNHWHDNPQYIHAGKCIVVDYTVLSIILYIAGIGRLTVKHLASNWREAPLSHFGINTV